MYLKKQQELSSVQGKKHDWCLRDGEQILVLFPRLQVLLEYLGFLDFWILSCRAHTVAFILNQTMCFPHWQQYSKISVRSVFWTCPLRFFNCCQRNRTQVVLC